MNAGFLLLKFVVSIYYIMIYIFFLMLNFGKKRLLVFENLY